MQIVTLQSIEIARNFIRSQNFIPLSQSKIEEYRKGINEQAHNNAIEGNHFTENDWALHEMFMQERAPTSVCFEALQVIFSNSTFVKSA